MPGLSDSKHPDDVRIHLEEIAAADDARAAPEAGESEREALIRRSVQLAPVVRERVERALSAVREVAPGLSDAEVKKILATRAARNALRDGQEVLARIDSHLLSVTGERNPPVGLNYGVFGRNPESFAGVYRALVHSDAENARIAALPEDDPDRSLLFTPFLQQQTQEVLGHLRA